MPTIRIDRIHRLIEVKLIGFYTRERATETAAAVVKAITSLGGDPNSHFTLYNLEHLQVTSAEAFDELSICYSDAGQRGYWARRVACYSPSALVRIQMSRLKTGRSDFGVFGDRATAIAWLVNGGRDTLAA